jgi:hypothetical protein
MATETKKAPVTLKQGMPPEQSNGMYGAEDQIMSLGVRGRFTAVVTFEVNDIVHSEKDAKTRPVVELVHVEPIWSAKGLESARGAQEEQYKVRTGANQLNFDGLGEEAGEQ